VKDYEALSKFFEKSLNTPLKKSLPKKAGMMIALRRSARVGLHEGAEVEDFGIAPDVPYRMTRSDLLDENADLIAYACGLFSALTVKIEPTRDGPRLDIATKAIRWVDGTMKKINEIDVLVDWRVKHKQKDVGRNVSIPLDPSAAGRPIEIQAYIRMPRSTDRNLIAVRRVQL